MNGKEGVRSKNWRSRLNIIIFHAETPAGKTFDVALIISIFLSILVVMLESVEIESIKSKEILLVLEWFFTILFTIEYSLRIISAKFPGRYAVSFFGLVDIASILPTYLSLFLPGAQVFMVVRVFRLLRLFRVLKMIRYVRESRILLNAINASKPKITVFILTILSICVIFGSIMFIVEGPENGFVNIPISMYWVIVTITTVGFGDISPKTPLGQIIASALMILAYGILAVPTGILSFEIAKATISDNEITERVCRNCNTKGHAPEASFCKICGTSLNAEGS